MYRRQQRAAARNPEGGVGRGLDDETLCWMMLSLKSVVMNSSALEITPVS